MPDAQGRPQVVVFSSLFPSPAQPNAGVFIRERMFRVAREIPLSVVSPAAWFPFQGLLRRFKPHFRPEVPRSERQSGIEVRRPRILSVPGVLKQFDGFLMAVGAYPTIRRLKAEGRADLIDAHFAYPDGYAATLLGRWLGVPVTITLRGTESRLVNIPRLKTRLLRSLSAATQIFSVCESLKRVAVGAGAPESRIEVVGNGIDLERFVPQDRARARQTLGLPEDAPVLISVGGLVPRKGMHRVIDLLPELKQRHPGLVYLVVGGPSAEGDIRLQLEQQVERLGLQDTVRLLGSKTPDELAGILSAADVFVLWTANEGWANVFLEAMACGLPVVTTDVGGNAEVVCDERVGTVVPFADAAAMQLALDAALRRPWDRTVIRQYAEQNSWDERVKRLCGHFLRITGAQRAT